MHGHDNLKASATMLIVIITHIHVGMYVLRSPKEKKRLYKCFRTPLRPFEWSWCRSPSLQIVVPKEGSVNGLFLDHPGVCSLALNDIFAIMVVKKKKRKRFSDFS